MQHSQKEHAIGAGRCKRGDVVATSPLAFPLNVRFTTTGMCAKNNTHIYVARTSSKSDHGMSSLLLLAATV